MEARHFPLFETRPDEAYVERWKDHISETGYPETFDNVSTVRPFDMAGVVVLSGELKVPIIRREDQALVPCPLCSPNSPKFGVGRQVYFPAEKTVLFIGHDCAKRHIGEDYVAADREYRREAKAKRILDIWGELQRKAPDLRETAAKLLPVAAALEQARNEFGKQAGEFLHNMLSEHRFGSSGITETVDTGLRDRKGKKVYETIQIGTLVGHEFCEKFSPATKLRAIIKSLEDLDHPLPDWRPGDEEGGERLDEILRRGRTAISAVNRMKTIRDHVSDARRFLHVNNLKLFERWGELDSSPFDRLDFRRKGSWIFLDSVSFYGHHKASFKVSDDLFGPIPDVTSNLFQIRGFEQE
nr:hypothetical protein REQ54_01757 [Rhizobium sp. Q54]